MCTLRCSLEIYLYFSKYCTLFCAISKKMCFEDTHYFFSVCIITLANNLFINFLINTHLNFIIHISKILIYKLGQSKLSRKLNN